MQKQLPFLYFPFQLHHHLKWMVVDSSGDLYCHTHGAEGDV